MCHCYQPVAALSKEEREELLEEHTTEELRAEYSGEELEQLGVSA
jgi:hypothetical protein